MEFTMKTCPKCQTAKELDRFAMKNPKTGLRSSECKDCHKVYRDAYYAANKRQEINRVTARRSRIYDQLEALKTKLVCTRCPENHIACLDFHHLNPEDKDINVSQAVSAGWSFERIQQEIAKCEVLCANCHRKLHHEMRV